MHEGVAVELKVQESREVRLITAPGFLGGKVLESVLAGETLCRRAAYCVASHQ